jgi:tetratricopeptide (TPR) repeat protein
VSANPRFNGTAFAVAVLLFAAASRLVLPLPAFGPTRAEAQTVRVREKRSDPYEITSKTAEAVRYLSTDPQRSLDILRDLDRQFPDNDRIVFRLGHTFQVMGRSDSAVVYYRRALSLNPRNMEAGKSLGTIYLSEDRRDDAIIVFDQLLSANGYSVGAYKAVGNSLRELGQYEEALAVLSEGRNRGKQYFVLTLEIADLHRSARQYEDALDEYLRYVDARRGNYRFTRDRVTEMMREVDDAGRIVLIEALDDRLESGAGNRYVTLDILAAMYLEQGLLEQSLDKAIQADGEKESDGTVLLTFADQVISTAEAKPREERRRYLDLGIRALDAFANNHPTASGTDRAKYMLATIYVRFGSGKVPGVTSAETLGWIKKAIQEYTELAKRYSGSEYAELANLERGDLLLHKMKQPGRALEAYKVGAVNSRRYGDVFAARIADVYLGTGEYDNGEHYFVSLERSGIYELAQTGMYYTGLLLAFRGEYDTARDTLTALAEGDPASPYSNDAIAAAWLIEEGLQFESAWLDAFMSAWQSEMLGDTAAVISKLESVVAGPVYDSLRPRALFKLGRTLAESGDLDGALDRYKRFLKEYPDSPLRPDVQRSIAAVYEFGYEEYERALREYEAVLMLYPDYAFLDEVRKDIRRLRFIVEGEE